MSVGPTTTRNMMDREDKLAIFYNNSQINLETWIDDGTEGETATTKLNEL